MQNNKKTTLLLIVILSFFYCTTNHKKTIKASKPNILFILVDDLGYSDLSIMGSNYYETPNIDNIATSGNIFTNGYAACSKFNDRSVSS